MTGLLSLSDFYLVRLLPYSPITKSTKFQINLIHLSKFNKYNSSLALFAAFCESKATPYMIVDTRFMPGNSIILIFLWFCQLGTKWLFAHGFVEKLRGETWELPKKATFIGNPKQAWVPKGPTTMTRTSLGCQPLMERISPRVR